MNLLFVLNDSAFKYEPGFEKTVKGNDLNVFYQVITWSSLKNLHLLQTLVCRANSLNPD